jgi:hypothetical protein
LSWKKLEPSEDLRCLSRRPIGLGKKKNKKIFLLKKLSLYFDTTPPWDLTKHVKARV